MRIQNQPQKWMKLIVENVPNSNGENQQQDDSTDIDESQRESNEQANNGKLALTYPNENTQ